MKRRTMLLLLIVCLLLAPGCKKPPASSEGADGPADNSSAGPDSFPTQEEVIAGSWRIYAGFDQAGNLVYAGDETDEFVFNFDAVDGFSGVYRSAGYVDSSFSGSYDVTDSKLVSKNPYDWYYYATIDENSITDNGMFGLVSKLGGSQGLSFIFEFRELDGEQILYDTLGRLYYKK